MSSCTERVTQFVTRTRENISSLRLPRRFSYLKSEETKSIALVVAAVATVLIPFVLQADNIKKMGGADPNYTRSILSSDNPPTYDLGCRILVTPGKIAQRIEVCLK